MSGTRGGMGFDLGFPASGGGSGHRVDPERPLRILVIGDFGGGQDANAVPVLVEPAEIDRAMAKIGVTVELEWEGIRRQVFLKSMDDLHPDALATELPWIERLVALRKRVKDPATSASGVREAKELGLVPPDAGSTDTPSADSAPSQPPPSGAGELSGLLGKGVGSGSKGQSAAGGVDIHSFIRKVVGSGAAAQHDPDSNDALRAIDRHLSTMMRALLRDARFARIESAWRALQHVAANAWDEESIRYEILSMTDPQLDHALNQGRADLDNLFRGSVGDPTGPVDLVLLVEPVVADEASISRAIALANAAENAGATLILSADASMVGSPGFGIEPDPARWQSTRTQPWREHWDRLVGSGSSARVAIALPRWLARRPYGLWSEPIERFTFEELDENERGNAAGHGLMCWAGGGWLLLRAIAEAWTSDGPDMQLGSPCIVGDLPHAAWKDASGSHALPCAECYLVERAVEAISQAGFIAAASMKGRDAVVLGPIQSIAGGNLAGRWG